MIFTFNREYHSQLYSSTNRNFVYDKTKLKINLFFGDINIEIVIKS